MKQQDSKFSSFWIIFQSFPESRKPLNEEHLNHKKKKKKKKRGTELRKELTDLLSERVCIRAQENHLSKKHHWNGIHSELRAIITPLTSEKEGLSDSETLTPPWHKTTKRLENIKK
jgi:hypothetical protein